MIFFVLSGGGDLVIDDEKFSLAANDSIEVAAGAMRSWRVTSVSDLELLVVKYLI